jgi:hypothetical protein
MKTAGKLLGTAVCACLLYLVFGFFFWQLSPGSLLSKSIRFAAVEILGVVYADDNADVQAMRRSYFHGKAPAQSQQIDWRVIEQNLPGFHLLPDQSISQALPANVPFIYEKHNADYLVHLRNKYDFAKIISGAAGEFEAMLLLAQWVGTRWDHGLERLSQEEKYNPVALIEGGKRGKHYWCEIAALVMVNSATSLGWPARLVSASRDGYHWQHAVAELWSNEYGKWFVVDADYNIVYMANGKPLSAFELCHQGLSLQQKGVLEVRQFAPMKPSLHLQDLLPYYRYVHIDLRNDWHSRRLRRGSPAGGDLSTWWTARPDLHHLLTAKKRVDSQKRFDWPVNVVAMSPVVDKHSRHSLLNIFLTGYGPYFKTFQVRQNHDDGWQDIEGSSFSYELHPGKHCLEARMVTTVNGFGPVSRVCYQYDNESR